MSHTDFKGLESSLSDGMDLLFDVMAMQKVLQMALDEAQERTSMNNIKHYPHLDFNEIQRVVRITNHHTNCVMNLLDDASAKVRVSGGDE